MQQPLNAKSFGRDPFKALIALQTRSAPSADGDYNGGAGPDHWWDNRWHHDR